MREGRHLDGELVVKVAEAEQVRPHALVRGEGVDAAGGAHGVKLGSEHGVAPDGRPVAKGELLEACVHGSEVERGEEKRGEERE